MSNCEIILDKGFVSRAFKELGYSMYMKESTGEVIWRPDARLIDPSLNLDNCKDSTRSVIEKVHTIWENKNGEYFTRTKYYENIKNILTNNSCVREDYRFIECPKCGMCEQMVADTKRHHSQAFKWLDNEGNHAIYECRQCEIKVESSFSIIMEDNIALPLEEFAELVNINIETVKLYERAYDYCCAYGESSKNDSCVERFVKVSRESVVEASAPSFEGVDLDLKLNNGEVYITPKTNWETTARKITELVDGYMGIIPSIHQSKYDSFKEMNDFPSEKKLVKDHLHWIKNYSNLYGTGIKPSSYYDNILEREFRNFW